MAVDLSLFIRSGNVLSAKDTQKDFRERNKFSEESELGLQHENSFSSDIKFSIIFSTNVIMFFL